MYYVRQLTLNVNSVNVEQTNQKIFFQYLDGSVRFFFWDFEALHDFAFFRFFFFLALNFDPELVLCSANVVDSANLIDPGIPQVTSQELQAPLARTFVNWNEIKRNHVNNTKYREQKSTKFLKILNYFVNFVQLFILHRWFF